MTLFTAITFSSFSSLSHAGLIIDTDNDSFIDATTGLEWMDFGINNGRSFDDVENNLGASGDYAGWRLPTHDEVFDMWNHRFFDEIGSRWIHREEGYISSSSSYTNKDLFNSIGANYTSTLNNYERRNGGKPETYARAYFYIDDSKTSLGFVSFKHLSERYDLGLDTIIWAVHAPIVNKTNINSRHSTLLVRGDSSSSATSVSEPATFAIFALGVLAMATRRFKRSL